MFAFRFTIEKSEIELCFEKIGQCCRLKELRNFSAFYRNSNQPCSVRFSVNRVTFYRKESNPCLLYHWEANQFTNSGKVVEKSNGKPINLQVNSFAIDFWYRLQRTCAKILLCTVFVNSCTWIDCFSFLHLGTLGNLVIHSSHILAAVFTLTLSLRWGKNSAIH